MRDGPEATPIRRRVLGPAERNRLMADLTGLVTCEPTVVFAYLFGSFLDDRPFADADLAVFLAPDRCRPAEFLDVQLDLTARLERALRMPVDVVILNTAPLGLRVVALRGRLICSRDEAARAAFLEDTSRQAMDTAYLRRLSLGTLLPSPDREGPRGE